jgi:glucose-1-phosphate adenylyltransferase
MDHVRNGEPWDLIGRERGVRILPPHTGTEDSDWYKGTADAVFQNMNFMEGYGPERVLILSGDHIYRMDYEAMIAAHEARGAEVTIGALPVPWEETHRFGVMVADGDGWITEFLEKVKGAKSNLASMGVYVFSYAAMVEELQAVVGAKKGYDFGRDILPGMLGRRKMLCYPFQGYWRDVGTIKSYHDASMDCLDPDSGLDLRAWEIRTVPDFRTRGDRPPIQVADGASVTNSRVARGCVIQGTVENSVLFAGVQVARGARVRDSILMHDTVVGDGCRVEYAIVDKQCVLGAGATIGTGEAGVANREFPGHLDCGISVIGKGAVVPPGLSIGKNCIIYPGVHLGRCALKRVEDGDTVTR